MRILLLLLMIALLQGCAVAVVGGAAAGGYYIGKDDRSVGQITDDGVITSSINAKYLQDSTIKTFDINVDTYRGNVTLSGNVVSRSVEARAVQLARSVKGVRSVTSKLHIISK